MQSITAAGWREYAVLGLVFVILSLIPFILVNLSRYLSKVVIFRIKARSNPQPVSSSWNDHSSRLEKEEGKIGNQEVRIDARVQVLVMLITTAIGLLCLAIPLLSWKNPTFTNSETRQGLWLLFGIIIALFLGLLYLIRKDDASWIRR